MPLTLSLSHDTLVLRSDDLTGASPRTMARPNCNGPLCRDLERLGNPSRQASLFLFSLLLSRLSLSLSFSFLFPLDLFLSPRRESPPRASRAAGGGGGDRPSVVMVVAVWCCGGDQISSLSCLLVPDLFRSPLPCLLFPDPDPDLG
ncbi:hypothetical protein F2Q69_00022211 [Brassica cretica]|uniref:Uncharacterized protein n=1 Tax=Brassica cretica TaxID=69181 RepID=A0A8S9QMX5_BRACR|nr:hypothetical protein F2Q69_00022211 [Brassica cretica]